MPVLFACSQKVITNVDIISPTPDAYRAAVSTFVRCRFHQTGMTGYIEAVLTSRGLSSDDPQASFVHIHNINDPAWDDDPHPAPQFFPHERRNCIRQQDADQWFSTLRLLSHFLLTQLVDGARMKSIQQGVKFFLQTLHHLRPL